MVSRRQLFQLAQGCLVAVAVPGKLFAAASKAGAALTWSQTSWQSVLNSTFAVSSPAGATNWLTLLSVEDMPAPAYQSPVANIQAATPVFETFALNFSGSGEDLPQGTYSFDHQLTGQFQLFIVPSGHSNYVAIISHPRNRPVRPLGL